MPYSEDELRQGPDGSVARQPASMDGAAYSSVACCARARKSRWGTPRRCEATTLPNCGCRTLLCRAGSLGECLFVRAWAPALLEVYPDCVRFCRSFDMVKPS